MTWSFGQVTVHNIMADVSALKAEVEQLTSRLTRQEIESEQALADLASRNSQLETLLQTESARAVEEKNAADQAKHSLELVQTQLDTVKSNNKTDSQASLTLKQRAESSEREKRDLLVQLQRLQDEKNFLQGVFCLFSLFTHVVSI